MTPQRMQDCLGLIRWDRDVLAKAIDVPSDRVVAWTKGSEEIPRKVGAWLEALCFVHEAAEATKPATSGGGFGIGPRQEYIPVYAYNLLRNLNHAPVQLRTLFGSDDEGAVFFLVSRGLAVRDGEHLVIAEAGRAVGSMRA